MYDLAASICRRLDIGDVRFIEIESKHRVLPEQAEALREHLLELKKVRHKKASFFFDQFLDTPKLDLLRLGASLRLRYKRDAAHVYLQYKGPGFHKAGVLYRSEFSSGRLADVVREESHHDVVHFTDTTVRDILETQAPTAMVRAMRRHLGSAVLARISVGTIVTLYQKDKFSVDLGSAELEPSLDRIFAFHISRTGLHPLSTFCEFENEVKAEQGDLRPKIEHLPDLLEFNGELAGKFDLRVERLDKYHRCAACFLPLSTRRA